MIVLRHLLAILLLPFMVVVVVPYKLHTAFTADDAFCNENLILTYLFCFVGLLFIFFGLILFSWCVSLFAKVGQGTLAPWDPTRNLVIIGPYRFVR
ncbi:MAG TPA: hypothetical protein VLH18_00205, partial [Candidatus Limnocylindrales bacterium]|nr:hypothetical protein [Candidatus Limnocylindrales bacterium]